MCPSNWLTSTSCTPWNHSNKEGDTPGQQQEVKLSEKILKWSLSHKQCWKRLSAQPASLTRGYTLMSVKYILYFQTVWLTFHWNTFLRLDWGILENTKDHYKCQDLLNVIFVFEARAVSDLPSFPHFLRKYQVIDAIVIDVMVTGNHEELFSYLMQYQDYKLRMSKYHIIKTPNVYQILRTIQSHQTYILGIFALLLFLTDIYQ